MIFTIKKEIINPVLIFEITQGGYRPSIQCSASKKASDQGIIEMPFVLICVRVAALYRGIVVIREET